MNSNRLIRFKTIFILGLSSFLILSSINSFSQDLPKKPAIIASELQKTQQQLLQIIKRRLALRTELDDLKKANQTQEVSDRIEDLKTELKGLARNFEVLASQLQEDELPKEKEEEMSWLGELQELTMPLLKAIHEISEKPRKTEKLKAKIVSLNAQILKHNEARKNLKKLLTIKNGETTLDPKIEQAYQKRLAKLENKYNPEFLRLKLEEAERSLLKIQNSQKSVLSAIKDTIVKFFKERGRNLFIALTTFFSLWWLLLKIFRIFSRRRFFIKKLDSQLRRLIKTVSNLLIVILSGISGLVSLYLLDDWLLLSIAILFMMAVFWTSRQLIPNFLKELRIIMNLGTVREKERIIWKGVPFLVKEIGIYSTLVNERLDGGLLRIPVGELIGHYSRPVVNTEPWFPTQKGDYVILDDGTYGRVESQTMEQVILYSIGSLKYYPTSDFMSQKLRNLSTGYRIVVKFGLDYGIQSRICDDIPKIFKEGLKKYLQKYYEKEPPAINTIHVNFDGASASSLDLIILVTINGAYAEDYYPLKWKINKTLVQICNDNNLVIPFTQLTMSLSDDVKKLASQQKS